MGIGENRCRRALIECNNNIENATNWIFERIDDECKTNINKNPKFYFIYVRLKLQFNDH